MVVGSAVLEDPQIARLGTSEVFSLWDLGKSRHRIDWALDLLSFGLPDFDWDRLCALPLGCRDGFLLALRGKSFGRQADLFAGCPSCAERVEFGIDVCDLIIADPFEGAARAAEDMTAGVLTSSHVAQALAQDGMRADAGAEQIYQLTQALRAAVGPKDADEDTQNARQQEGDPMAILSFPMTCPNCATQWSPVLDVPELLWADIVSQGKRALSDVHDLAQAYGWTEDVILAMGSERRAAYIALIHR